MSVVVNISNLDDLNLEDLSGGDISKKVDITEIDTEIDNSVVEPQNKRKKRLSSVQQITQNMLESVDDEFKFEGVEDAIDNLDYYMYYTYTTVFPTDYDELREESPAKAIVRVLCTGSKGCIRMMLCVTIQTVITPIMIYYSINSNPNMCSRNSTPYQKITAAIFTLYINISSINSLSDQVVIYTQFDTFFILYHKFVSKHFKIRNRGKRRLFNFILNVLLSINIISCVLTTIGSVIIIYNSKTILEIILNSLALKFIDEIDNMSITKSEVFNFKNIYSDIKHRIKDNMSFFENHVPRKIKQVVKLLKKICLMYFVGFILSITLYIFTILAEIWIIACY